MTTACEHLHEPDWEHMDGPVLIAGDVHDLSAIAEVCRRLPWNAMGTVILEAAARVQIRHVDVPEGVSVRWLMRGDGTQARARGERLGISVHAWCVEWACAEPETDWTVWLGPHTPPRVAQMARSLLGVSAPPQA
ncbi:SIP domain-containing protein [Microbacterium murale]|uniref:SIP domain-containing protein n=1 Tax=Microbacterium murale TaxID=1081040 RepID=UPI0027D774F4|nr:SIP domain-containing protein [Microbacterium murale]